MFASAVYTLPDPGKYVGAAGSANPLGDLAPEDLELREGCTVFLKYDGQGGSSGGTDRFILPQRACGEPAYATSEVIVTPAGSKAGTGVSMTRRSGLGSGKRCLRVSVGEAGG